MSFMIVKLLVEASISLKAAAVFMQFLEGTSLVSKFLSKSVFALIRGTW